MVSEHHSLSSTTLPINTHCLLNTVPQAVVGPGLASGSCQGPLVDRMDPCPEVPRRGGPCASRVRRRCLVAMLVLSGSAALAFTPPPCPLRPLGQTQLFGLSHARSMPNCDIRLDTRLYGKRRERPERPGENVRPDEDTTSVTKHIINWYPGHIAKAESELQEYIKMVDVIIETRDARIPASTTHPLVRQWVGKRPLIVAMTRRDMAAPDSIKEWQSYYTHEARRAAIEKRPKSPVLFLDARQGLDVHKLKMLIFRAGAAVNQRRRRLGLLPRSIRVAVIGYPNVGKSALINKLIGRKIAKSKNLPGVTKRLQWIRLGINNAEGQSKEETLELLDSPGIIPAKQIDQEAALKLAVCNDIGQASYDVQVVAARLIDHLREVYDKRRTYVQMERVVQRYDLNPLVLTGEEVLHRLAQKMYKGNLYSAADRILGDFRKGLLGPVTLEVPPKVEPLPEYRPPQAPVSKGKKKEEEEDEEDEEHGDEEEMVEEGEAGEEEEEEEEGRERKPSGPRLIPEKVVIGVGEFEGW